MQSDAAFIIGKTHKFCQDYAIASDERSAIASVWLSDGCSSSPHTDIGARLLTHGMKEQIATVEKVSFTCAVHASLTRAAKTVQQMGLPLECMDATLLGLIWTSETLQTVLYGDGAIVYGRTDGTRLVCRSRYPASFPYYPAYGIDPKRQEQWKKVANNPHTITKTVLRQDGSVEESETFCPPDDYHLLEQPVEGIRWAAVLSDGIESFQQHIGSETSSSFAPVDYLDVVRGLTAFKNFKGEFVHRRMQAFEKDCARRGWHHNDDISVTAMYFGEGERES